ncbi:MAG: hypothetical protein ACK5MD_10480 [Flavobacteriales bacterium]
MRIKFFLNWLIILYFLPFLSCKEGIKEVQRDRKNVDSNVVLSQSENKIDELFVGKKFYSGDELNKYTFIKSDELNKGDSLTYSIYKENNKEEYVFCIEKLISNADQERYKIIDIFRFSSYSSETKIQLIQDNNEYNVLLVNNGEILKKWTFTQNKIKQTNTVWNGEYEGTFLRLKDESADPRAWGLIKLEINGKKAQLNIDSYVEIVETDMEVISESSNQMRLKNSSNDYYITLNKEKGKIILEGNLMESIVGDKEKYEIMKVEK